MKEGDEILTINGNSVQGKTVDQVAEMMSATPGPVDFEIKAADDTEMPILSVETFVKAQFNYNPEQDRYHPCTDLGLSFNVGDILHVLNQNDPNWWQAVKENEERSMARLIPGKIFRESLDTRKPKPADSIADQKSKKKKSKSKKKQKHVYRFEEPGDFDMDEILSYEEVVKVDPDPNYKRPIVLIGLLWLCQ
jgi:MAGUK p55 subfamily protein 5